MSFNKISSKIIEEVNNSGQFDQKLLCLFFSKHVRTGKLFKQIRRFRWKVILFYYFFLQITENAKFYYFLEDQITIIIWIAFGWKRIKVNFIIFVAPNIVE